MFTLLGNTASSMVQTGSAVVGATQTVNGGVGLAAFLGPAKKLVVQNSPSGAPTGTPSIFIRESTTNGGNSQLAAAPFSGAFAAGWNLATVDAATTACTLDTKAGGTATAHAIGAVISVANGQNAGQAQTWFAGADSCTTADLAMNANTAFFIFVTKALSATQWSFGH